MVIISTMSKSKRNRLTDVLRAAIEKSGLDPLPNRQGDRH